MHPWPPRLTLTIGHDEAAQTPQHLLHTERHAFCVVRGQSRPCIRHSCGAYSRTTCWRRKPGRTARTGKSRRSCSARAWRGQDIRVTARGPAEIPTAARYVSGGRQVCVEGARVRSRAGTRSTVGRAVFRVALVRWACVRPFIFRARRLPSRLPVLWLQQAERVRQGRGDVCVHGCRFTARFRA